MLIYWPTSQPTIHTAPLTLVSGVDIDPGERNTVRGVQRPTRLRHVRFGELFPGGHGVVGDPGWLGLGHVHAVPLGRVGGFQDERGRERGGIDAPSASTDENSTLHI